MARKKLIINPGLDSQSVYHPSKKPIGIVYGVETVYFNGLMGFRKIELLLMNPLRKEKEILPHSKEQTGIMEVYGLNGENECTSEWANYPEHRGWIIARYGNCGNCEWGGMGPPILRNNSLPWRMVK